MTSLTLMGFDPGIKDTGATALQLDFARRHLTIHTQVWTGVSERIDKKPVTDKAFLKGAQRFVADHTAGATFVGIEGYRQRGFDIHADAAMLQIVNDLDNSIAKAKIVDNTNIKNVVKPGLLRLFHCSRFYRGTNHSDLKSAARVALKYGIENEMLNILLSDYVKQNLEEPWSHESTSTQ